MHVLWPRGSDRVREQKGSVLSLVLHSQAGAARSAAVSLRKAHSQSQNNLSRQCWRSRRRPEGQMQLTPFLHLKEKSVRRKCTASLIYSRPSLVETLYFQGLPVSVLYFWTSFINECEEHIERIAEAQKTWFGRDLKNHPVPSPPSQSGTPCTRRDC